MNHNQGLGSSMGWTGHQSLVPRESCSTKAVQESLLEELCIKNSVVSDESQDVESYLFVSLKSKISDSLSARTFHSHRGLSSGNVKSGVITSCEKRILHSKKLNSVKENFESQHELSKNGQSVRSCTNYKFITSSYSGVNMNSNFMCRTMFLMNDNLQNNTRVLPKNVFSTPTESSPFVEPKCNFDSNSFCCGSNGLAFGDKHVVAKHQLSICGIPTAEEKPSEPPPPPPDQRLSEDKCLPKPKERPFSCEECGKSFLLKHHLTTHIRVHTGERPYVCSECGKSFAHKHCLVTHQRLHTGERPYTCLECKKSFTLKHHLVTHTRVHSRERPFACDECGRTFSQKRHLVTHSKLHTGERPFACDECGESFSQKEHLTTHSRFHGGERPYVCPDCGNAFQRKFQLVSHARLHGKRPYSCHSCGKEFLQKRTLVAHTRLHTGERPFSCQHCGEAFGRKCELAVHSRAAHTTGGRSFACRQCGNCFASREGLALHLRLHAGDICGVAFSAEVAAESRLPPAGEVSQPQKPHLCLQCGKSFAQKHGLVQHTKRHSGEKPHSCDKCGKSFAQKYSLSLHSRLHPPVEEPVSGPAAMLHAPMMQHSSPALHSASPVVQHAPALRPPMQHSSPPTPSN